MANDSYNELIRKALHGEKYINGQLNPLYNPKWGLRKGAYLSMARSYAKNQNLFIGTSKTEHPTEFIELGIIREKAQYQFRELEKEIKGYASETSARTRAVDVSRLAEFITKHAGKEARDITPVGQTEKEYVDNPAVTADLYLRGEISREEFFKRIKEFQENDIEYLNTSYESRKH